MSYRSFDELKKLPKSEAKKLYKAAYSDFKISEKIKYNILGSIGWLGVVIGNGIGVQYSNSTHLFVYTGLTCGVIGYLISLKLIDKQLVPYVKKLL